MNERVFGRRYRLTEKIGTGGMAEVYKAVDDVLGRTVAVKVLHPRYAADPNFTARFRQEAQAAANLQSPYIVNIYDWGKDGDAYYIVMELVRGTDLKSIIEQEGPLESRRVAQIGAQVCSALSIAHGYDVIHRDIKPHNIMVTPDGSVKVMDFGIARAGNTTMTQTGSVLGTAHYVSPEQAQGRTLSAASDLYSLGIVLYEAATGELPFNADSPVAVALKQVNETPVSPRRLNPDVDPGLETVILKAMGKQASERYETADQMRQDLQLVAQGRDVTTVIPPSVPVHAADETAVMPAVGAGRGQGAPVAVRAVPRRRPVWPWILLALLLVAAGLVAAYYTGLIGTQMVPVPNVVNTSLTEAEAMIAEAELAVGTVKEEYSNDIEKGYVISQSPAALSMAEKQSGVDLVVSKGARLTTVPEIVGLTEAEAQEALAAANLKGVPLPDEYDESEPGTVFRQVPDPNTEVAENSEVQYVVSRGKRTVAVPDVTGLTRAAAQEKLAAAKFKVAIAEQYSATVTQGKVITQNPSKGVEVVEGSLVTITVSKGPDTVTVPDVIGAAMNEAVATLESAGLKVKIVYEPHAENGNVIDQSPKTGTAKIGSTVTIVVDATAP